MKKIFTCLAIALVFSFKSFSIPKLNSLPGATATLFLDFDGQTVLSSYWNGGNPLFCAASGMTDIQITEVFNRVAEDFRPFNLNITTDSVMFLAAPLVQRARIIITPTSGWCPGALGISYVGSFSYGDDIPSFIFSDRLGPNIPKNVAEACSHESGHAVGLTHQSRYGSDCTTPTEQYHTGNGSGEIGWAPIMGFSLNKNMSNWNNGPTPYGCNDIQDNLSIIATQNGFTYRADDYGEALNSGTYSVPSTNFSVNGIISTNSDKDAFKFVLVRNSNFHLTAVPFGVGANNNGANLDIKLEFYNAAGTLINTYDPAATLNVTVDTVLFTGTYYVKISGTGNANISGYGSLGSYTISGTSGLLPIHDVSLHGTVEKNKHHLGWSIIADEAIRNIYVETSKDGISFNTLTSVVPTAAAFTYAPTQNGIIYYRLKVTSVLDQTMYSNTISLKATGNVDQPFFVSTLVHNEITVNAGSNYQYMLSDINGRMINLGTGLKGINKISVYNQPNGMYVIQLLSNDQKQTERIIRQ